MRTADICQVCGERDADRFLLTTSGVREEEGAPVFDIGIHVCSLCIECNGEAVEVLVDSEKRRMRRLAGWS